MCVSELRPEDTATTELGAEEAGAADAAAAITKGAFVLPRMVCFPMVALRVDDFAATSFTAACLKERAFASVFFTLVAGIVES